MQILFFTSPTCAYCEPMYRLLKTSLAETGIHVPVQKIDVTQNINKATQYHISSTPTVLWLNASKNVVGMANSIDKRRLMEWIRETHKRAISGNYASISA